MSAGSARIWREQERDLRTLAGRHTLLAFRRRAAGARDKVQLALGVLWIIDGLLQLQPAMFTRQFASGVIDAAAQGQPGFIQWPVHQAAHLIASAPGTFNVVFAVLQLGIGAGLLFRRTVTAAIVLSILWSLNVWILGEGLGGLAGGTTTLLTGAPGAALLYLILSAAAWPSRERLSRWLVPAWVVLWLGGAAIQLLPGQASDQAIRVIVASNAAGAPRWMAQANHWLLSVLPARGHAAVICLVVLEVCAGLSVLGPRRAQLAGLRIGIVLSVGFWLFGESLGTYWTGLATDPNSGPLLVLMTLAVSAALPRDASAHVSSRRAQRAGQPVPGTVHAKRPDHSSKGLQPVALAGLCTVVSFATVLGWALVVRDGTSRAPMARGALGGIPSRVDVGFSQEMPVHHAQAVYMAQIVQHGRGASPEIRALANTIEVAQLQEIGWMGGWLNLWNEPALPTGDPMGWMSHGAMYYTGMSGATMPGMATQPEINQLAKASGNRLDILFLQLMLRHHVGGIEMALYAARYAHLAPTRVLAKRIILDQNQEITLMGQLLRLYKARPLPFVTSRALAQSGVGTMLNAGGEVSATQPEQTAMTQ